MLVKVGLPYLLKGTQGDKNPLMADSKIHALPNFLSPALKIIPKGPIFASHTIAGRPQ